jgi:murein DD-endopeptidase MepM/ murein hydrolase activator NlpD
MSATPSVLFIIIAIIVIFVAGCTQPAVEQQQAPGIPEVKMTNPLAPVPVASTDGVNIAYELELTTPGDIILVPEKIEVIDKVTGKTLYTPNAEVFSKSYMPASSPPPTAAEMINGTLKLSVPRISIWFKVSPDAVPDSLIHRLTLNGTASGLPQLSVTGGEVTVRKDLEPVVISSPMRGSGWVAMETTEPTTHHFLWPVTINGVTTVDQRYAQDWFYIDPVTGQAVQGDLNLTKNYLGYGKELLAVANGTVVDIRDDLPDNGIYKVPPFSFATGPGNSVIIDIGNNKYACYVHTIPGSIRVKKGDTVKVGQVIALLGNSGQSDIPHLHFEVVTGKPTIMGGEGYPFVFRSFDLIAKFNQTLLDERTSSPDYNSQKYWSEFGDFISFFSQPVPQQNKLTENWAIVQFP